MSGATTSPDNPVILLSIERAGKPTLTGSAFLARRGNQLGLFTAAHVATGARPRFDEGFLGWPITITAHMGADRVALPLFELNPTVVKFSWARNADGETMADMMGLFSPYYTAPLERLAEHFAVFDFDPSLMPEEGDRFTCYGYPGYGAWPSPVPCAVSGAFKEHDNGMYSADMATIPGYSGGPVLLDDGRLIGMGIGTDDSYTIGDVVPLYQLDYLGR